MNDFSWAELDDKDVEAAVRGNIVMLSMETTNRPLDVKRVRALSDRLSYGLLRLEEIKWSS